MAENTSTDTVSTVRKILWNVVFVVFYPIITTFSLLFMGIIWFFSSISRLIAGIGKRDNSQDEPKTPMWQPLISVGNVQIEKLYVDEVLFGPTSYKYRAKPEAVVFDENYYGDFVYQCFGGFLLQKWISTDFDDSSEFMLLYFDPETLQTIELQRIKSFSWVASPINDNEVSLKWFNGIEGGEIRVNKNDIEQSKSKHI